MKIFWLALMIRGAIHRVSKIKAKERGSKDRAEETERGVKFIGIRVNMKIKKIKQAVNIEVCHICEYDSRSSIGKITFNIYWLKEKKYDHSRMTVLWWLCRLGLDLPRMPRRLI